MCEQCAKLDEKIERYRALARRVTDQRMLEAIASLNQTDGGSESRTASIGRLI
jgi:hypothetical protein